MLVLVVEDDPGLAELAARVLQRQGLEVVRAEDGAEALAQLDANEIDLVVADYCLGSVSCREILDHLKSARPEVPFVIITGQGDERLAVELMKQGAQDYLVKDGDFLDRLAHSVERLLQEQAGRAALEATRQALLRSQGFNRLMVENLPDGILVLGPEGNILEANPAALQLFGLPQDCLAGLGLDSLGLSPSWLENLPAEGRTLCQTVDANRVLEIRLARSWGSEVLCLARDVTEHSRNERRNGVLQALAALALDDLSGGELLERALELLQTPGWVEGIGGCSVSRYERGRMRPVAERELLAHLPAACQGACGVCAQAADEAFACGHMNMCPEGHLLVVPIRRGQQRLGVLAMELTQPLEAATRDFLATVADTMAGGLVRRRLQDEQSRLARAMDRAQEGVLLCTSEGHVVYANRAVQEHVGVPVERLSELFPQGLPLEWREACGSVLRERPFHGRLPFRGRTLEVNLSPVDSEDSGQRTYVATVSDVTEALLAEERLRVAQKMQAIGTLAGGIAHDFNNILAIILATAELVCADLPPGDMADDMGQIVTAAERARDLIGQIQTFSRPTEFVRVAVNVDQLLGEVTAMLGAVLPRSVEISTRVESGLGSILGDSSQLHRVLVNLATNAAQAMGDQGVLTLEARSMGSKIRLSVKDTGPGLDPIIAERIFDPYFTTRAEQGGTGLGLASVHGIVNAHGGEICVESAPGEGAVFHLDLLTAEPAEPPAATAPGVTAGAGGHVALVDDEECLLQVGRRFLERLGYRVSTFAGPRAALEAFEQDPQLWDLLITDCTMPTMTGLTLAARIKDRRSELPVLLVTGHLKDDLDTGLVDQVLLKPFWNAGLGPLLADLVQRGRARN